MPRNEGRPSPLSGVLWRLRPYLVGSEKSQLERSLPAPVGSGQEDSGRLQGAIPDLEGRRYAAIPGERRSEPGRGQRDLLDAADHLVGPGEKPADIDDGIESGRDLGVRPEL